MIHRKKFANVVSVILCIMMLASVAPFAALAANSYDAEASDYYNVISKQDWDIAPGVTESEIVLNNDGGTRRQVLHVMEVDTSNEYASVMTSYTNMQPETYITKDAYAVSGMSKHAAAIEENFGYNVVGGMNCCLSWYNGEPYASDRSRINEPLGVMVVDGFLMNDQSHGFPTCLVINKDDRPEGMAKVEMKTINSSNDLTGYEEQVIPTSSGFILENGVIKASKSHGGDDAPRSVVGIKADGTVVFMMNDGRQSPYSVGMTTYELAETMLSLGCTYAVNCDGGGSSTFLSQRPGEELEINCSMSEGVERNNTSGIMVISTAPANGEFYKAHITTDDAYYTPGSTVQFNAIGTDMSGAEVAIPTDVEWQLTDSSLGEIDANGLFTSNGTTGEVVAKLAYNGATVGEATVKIVVPEISFKMDTLVLPYGETSTINLNVTTNNGRNAVATKPGDIILTLSDANMGTIDGLVFTTCKRESGVTGGTMYAKLSFDESITAETEVKFGKASDVAADFEDDYNFAVDTSKTGKNEDGSYIYGWHASDTRYDNSVGYRWITAANNAPVGRGLKSDVYLVDKTTGKVHSGEHALAFNADYTRATAMGSKEINIWFPEDYDVSEATSFGLWLYMPNLKHLMQTGCCLFGLTGLDATGKSSIRVDLKAEDILKKCGFEDEGWYYLSWNIPASKLKTASYIRINIKDASNAVINAMCDYTFYIDDVTIDYSDAVVDRENPYFTSLGIANEFDSADEMKGQTITTNTVTLIAQAQENTTKENATGLDMTTAKVTVDGKPVTTGISTTQSGKISVSNLNLNDGVHTIRFSVCDGQGNEGSVTRKVTVNTKQSDVRMELAENYNEVPAGSLVYFNLVADNIVDVQSASVKINLDQVNEWELEGMETACGFDAEYSVTANQEVSITFTRNGKEVDENNTVLAKLPVRIWTAKGYSDHAYDGTGRVTSDPALQDKGYILRPYAMWQTDGCYMIHVIADMCEGIVTYTDNSVKTFSSDEFEVSTELNRYRNSAIGYNGVALPYSDFTKGKASFHIHEAGVPQDKAPTCTEPGYTGRIFCVGCTCEQDEFAKKSGKTFNCDCKDGCGSVLVWGTTIPAAGHDFANMADGMFTCPDCGKTYYVKNGQAQSGIYYVDEKVCSFDGTGKCTVIDKYDGFVNVGDTVMYFIGGEYVKGTFQIANKFYFFDDNGLAYNGEIEIAGYNCQFDKGLFVANEEIINAGRCGDDAYFVILSNGNMYIDGSGKMTDYTSVGMIPWYNNGRNTIKAIYIDEDIQTIGTRAFYYCSNLETVNFEGASKVNTIKAYSFGRCNSLKTLELPDSVKAIYGYAFYTCNGMEITMPNVNSIASNSFIESSNITLVVYKDSYAYNYAIDNGMTYKLLEQNTPEVKQGLVKDDDGELRYYVDGKPTYGGLVQDAEGNYYYVSGSSQKAVKNCTYYVSKTNGLMAAGNYKFGADGKMVVETVKQGLVKDDDGELRYYVDGKPTYGGLVQDAEGNYYYVSGSSQKAVKNCTYYVSKTNGLMAAGNYKFGADGKMILD